jgi:hypothetical protein
MSVALSAQVQFIQASLRQVLSRVRSLIQVNYLVLDGAYGYNEVMQMARQLDLSLISKLKRNAALYLSYQGESLARQGWRQQEVRREARLPAYSGQVPAEHDHLCPWLGQGFRPTSIS